MYSYRHFLKSARFLLVVVGMHYPTVFAQNDSEPSTASAIQPVSDSDIGLRQLDTIVSRLFDIRKKHNNDIQATKDNAERERLLAEFPKIKEELDELVVLEKQYRGTRAGHMALLWLAKVAQGYTGTERPIHKSLELAFTGLDSYGDSRDSMLLLQSLTTYEGLDTLQCYNRLIDAPATTPEVKEFAKYTKAIWLLNACEARKIYVSYLERERATGESERIAAMQRYLDKYPDESEANKWHEESLGLLAELAKSSSGYRSFAPKMDSSYKYVFTEEEERSLENPTIAELASGKLFQERHFKPGKPAPKLDTELVTGENWSLLSRKSKVTIVMFCFEGCGPCEAMYPSLRKLVDKHPNDVDVLTIMTDETVAPAKKSVESEKITWAVAWDGPKGPISTQWGIQRFPSTFIFDAKKEFLAADVPGEYIDQVVEHLLKQ